MPVQLVGNLNESPLWRAVRQTAEEWLECHPCTAARWTLVVRRKCPADDDMLVLECDWDCPNDYWAVYVDEGAQSLVVAVAVDGDEDLIGPNETAACLIALLSDAADPSGP
jgi:hypothetical protein